MNPCAPELLTVSSGFCLFTLGAAFTGCVPLALGFSSLLFFRLPRGMLFLDACNECVGPTLQLFTSARLNKPVKSEHRMLADSLSMQHNVSQEMRKSESDAAEAHLTQFFPRLHCVAQFAEHNHDKLVLIIAVSSSWLSSVINNHAPKCSAGTT